MRIISSFLMILGLTGCLAAQTQASILPTSTMLAPPPVPSLTPTPGRLSVEIRFPVKDSIFEMGQGLQAIVVLTGADGDHVSGAEVNLELAPPGGTDPTQIPLNEGEDGVYRSQKWFIPHQSSPGTWQVRIRASTPGLAGEASTQIEVTPSLSEILLARYGYWLDQPALRGIVPSLLSEKGDSRNGMVRMGGAIASQHILPANYVDVNWRSGKFPLDTPEEVRKFLLEEIGYLSFSPVREILEITPYTFKNWPGWNIKGQSELSYQKLEWLVFYSPEMNLTYCLTTLVVHAPAGIDAHNELRKSFAVAPELNAQGRAPEELESLLPGPRLVSPSLGQRFEGANQPILLRWEPVTPLGKQDYYQVSIVYDYFESTNTLLYFTHTEEFAVPPELLAIPNCAIFNWQVQLMRQTDVDRLDRPVGYPLSYPSLYWYINWRYPAGVEKPFTYYCPNPLT